MVDKPRAQRVWMGWKGQKPATLGKVGWTAEDINFGDYVCLEPACGSEYPRTSRFEVAKVIACPEDLISDDVRIGIAYQQFDK